MEPYALLMIIGLPFLAGLAAVLLPSNSRTPVTWLAGTTTTGLPSIDHLALSVGQQWEQRPAPD